MAGSQQKPPTEHAHQLPPESIRALHKHYQRVSVDALALDHRVLDFANLSDFHAKRLRVIGKLRRAHLQQIFAAFESDANGLGRENEREYEGTDIAGECAPNDVDDKLIYEHEFLPGLSHLPVCNYYCSNLYTLANLRFRAPNRSILASPAHPKSHTLATLDKSPLKPAPSN